MPFRGLDLTGGGAGSASGSRNLLVNQHSFLTISLICLSVLPSTGTPSWARGSSSRQPPVSLQKLKHLRTGLQGAGEPTAQHFMCGTPEPPGALLWVPCAGCRPFPIWLGFQGSFLPRTSQSPPGHTPRPHRHLPGPPRSFSEDLFSDITGKTRL